MLRSIVLGANGQDGSYLCELLAASGQQVIGVGRQPDYARPLPNGKFQYVQIDLCDREALRAVLTSKNPLHIYSEPGLYYDTLKITSQNNCQAIIIDSIQVVSSSAGVRSGSAATSSSGVISPSLTSAPAASLSMS